MKLDTPAEKVSYLIGRQVGDQLKGSQFEGFAIDGVLKGIQDSMANAEMPLSQEQIEEAYQVIQGQMQEMQAKAAEAAKKVGEDFLAENGKKEGVITLESGLQYEIITEGNGAQPTRESTVRTHYHGTFIDGSVFDSSVERGDSVKFQVNRVIAGWTEALQKMKVGDKWRLTIPAELAYGAQSPSPKIPANSALVFEVELLGVEKS